MKKQNYSAVITADATPEKAFKAINNVSKWWSENTEGTSEKLNDVFTVSFGGETFVTFQIVELVPYKKVIWLVTDCYLPWLKDKTEWKDTKISFEILTEDDSTKIYFSHIGLVPEIECYDSCVKGWDQYIKGSLVKLITEGEGMPQKKKETEAFSTAN